MNAPVQMPVTNTHRFRVDREADWLRLDALLTRMEKKSIRALSDDDLLSLPLLYRSALSSLSLARETSLDRDLVAFLEQLCARAYFQIYGVPSSAGRALSRFFLHDWPSAIGGLWRETLAALMLTLLGAIAGYWLVATDPAWFFGMIPESMAQGRGPGAATETLRQSIYGKHQDGLTVFAAYLFSHNSQVAIFAFALGFAFCLPTILLLIYNGLMLGAMMAVFVPKGLGVGFAAWLSIHGTTELFAIILAGAAGMKIGLAVAFPGRQLRLESAVAAGRTAATAMVGVVLMLLVAGLLEGIGRQTILSDGNRFLVGAAMLAGWISYFYIFRRRHAVVAV